jgi:hypothetical protein
MNNRATEEDIQREVVEIWAMREQEEEIRRNGQQEEDMTRLMTAGKVNTSIGPVTQGKGAGAAAEAGVGARTGGGAGAGAGAVGRVGTDPGALSGQGQALPRSSSHATAASDSEKQPDSVSSSAATQPGYDSSILTFPRRKKKGKKSDEEEEEDSGSDLELYDGSEIGGTHSTAAGGANILALGISGSKGVEKVGSPTVPPLQTAVQARRFLNNFVINQAQPSEEPPESIERRRGRESLDSGVSTFMGRMITLRDAEYGSDDTRKRRSDDVDPNMAVNKWHTMSSKPERFFPSEVPKMGMNAYMRRLIQGTKRMFNPLAFVILPEGMTAIRKRDRYIKSSWPLIKEKLIPAAVANELDTERVNTEQTLIDTANRMSGSMDAIEYGDVESGLSHLKDAYLVVINAVADLEAVRKATETGNDVLVRKRRSMQDGIPTMGSTTEMMYVLGKRDQAQSSFFLRGTGARQGQSPLSQPAAVYTGNNQQQFGQGSSEQYYNNDQQGQQLNQQPYQQQGGFYSRRRRSRGGFAQPQLQLLQQLPQQQGMGRGRGYLRGFGRGARGGVWRGGFVGRGRGANPNFQQPIPNLPPVPNSNTNLPQ